MPLPNPKRCIWCRSDGPFDRSHVIPECLGNASAQVLPPGIVCKGCNNYFSRDIEAAFLNFPPVHVFAALLGVIDPGDGRLFRDKLFGETLVPMGVPSEISVEAITYEREPGRLDYRVHKPVVAEVRRDFSVRSLAFLSRAVHKIALEAIAWNVFVKGNSDPVDVFSTDFDPIRDWSRRGEPQRTVRPFLWCPREEVANGWTVRVPRVIGMFPTDLRLFADWYGLMMLGANTEAATALRVTRAHSNTRLISENLKPVKRV